MDGQAQTQRLREGETVGETVRVTRGRGIAVVRATIPAPACVVSAAEAPADGRQRELYYIDLEDESTQQARVKTVFPHANGTSGLAVVPFQGTFGQWCQAVLTGGG